VNHKDESKGAQQNVEDMRVASSTIDRVKNPAFHIRVFEKSKMMEGVESDKEIRKCFR
jgi:hypothetical protein